MKDVLLKLRIMHPENGHLDVIKFLRNIRTEGCTSRAIDDASGNGHLEVIIFLHYERDETMHDSCYKFGIC
jgi:hypothetical protein